MFLKSWWKKIKAFLLERVEKALTKEIEKLDRYEVELANEIRKQTNPTKRAKQVVDWVQAQLSKLVSRTFSSKWFSRSFFDKLEVSLLKEVNNLDKYEKELAKLAKKKLNPDEISKLIVDSIQSHAKVLVKKYIHKI